MKKLNIFVYAAIIFMFASCVSKVTVIGKAPVKEGDEMLFDKDYYVDVITKNGDTITAIAEEGVVFDVFPKTVNAYSWGAIDKSLIIRQKDM